jgi:hypothetical protein
MSKQIFQDIQIVRIEYTIPQIYAIQRLNITRDDNFNYCGFDYDLDMERMIEWFDLIGSSSRDDSVIYSRLVVDIVQMACKQAGFDSCWLTIRSRLPTTEYKIPRFHRDGQFYKLGPNQIQRKFLLTIKGPGTLVSEPDKETIDEFFDVFYANQEKQIELDVREKLAQVLGPENIIQLTNNQGAWIITHQSNTKSDRATIHSEPDITHPRLFLSILPGTNKQIESIRSRFCK